MYINFAIDHRPGLLFGFPQNWKRLSKQFRWPTRIAGPRVHDTFPSPAHARTDLKVVRCALHVLPHRAPCVEEVKGCSFLKSSHSEMIPHKILKERELPVASEFRLQ